MAGIFISYRREDAAGHAGRLHHDLAERFGRDRVFMDIDTLQPGIDFVTSLDEAVETSDAFLALIGPRWLSITDADGNRRLDKPNDFVSLEIATALARADTLVIPVLVGNARMPPTVDLPEPLKALGRRHAFDLSDRRWDYDVETLIKRLEPVVTPTRSSAGTLQSTGVASSSSVDFRAWLEPERIHSNGPERVELVVENLSPQTVTFSIAARRKDAELDIAVETALLELGARAKQSVRIDLTPRSEGDLAQGPSPSEPRALEFAVHVGPFDVPAAGRDIAGLYFPVPAAISLRLAKHEIEAPGEGTFEIEVENFGPREVTIALEAEDRAGKCNFTFDQVRQTIAQRSVAHVTLIVAPPARHASDARWPFDVRARPIAPGGPPVQDHGVLIFAPLRVDLRLPHSESETTGPGVFVVEVENLEATEVTVEMSAATDPCTYAFDRPRDTIPPGSVMQFELTVTPPDDHPIDAHWKFEVLASPVGSRAETARASGVLVYRPPIAELTVTPAQASARREAKYDVSVHNPSHVSQTLKLTADDPSGKLNLHWRQGSAGVVVDLPPSRTTVVPLRVSPIVRYRGTAPRTFAFSVIATPVRPPGHPLYAQARYVALPARRWLGRFVPQWRPRRLSLLVGTCIVLALLGLLDVGGIPWPELLVAVAPMVGGILLRTVWWVLLYPVVLGAGLVMAEDGSVQHDFDPTTISSSVEEAITATAGDRLNDALTKMDGFICDELEIGPTQEVPSRLARVAPTPPPCQMSEAPSGEYSIGTVTEWSILALAVLSAVIGTVIGKVIAAR